MLNKVFERLQQIYLFCPLTDHFNANFNISTYDKRNKIKFINNFKHCEWTMSVENTNSEVKCIVSQ